MKVLVVAPHPDDETLGVGGTLLRHISNGDEVFWCVLTLSFRNSSLEYRMARESMVKDVVRAYAFADAFVLDYYSGELDMVPQQQIIDTLASVMNRVEPNVVYCVGPSDVNTDHDIVYRCMMSATKPSYATSIRDILLYEVPSSTNWAFPGKAAKFQPNVYVDIEATIDRKIRILDLFGSELKDYPHPRSKEAVKALAMYRGSSVNVKYAEAFCLVRRIEK